MTNVGIAGASGYTGLELVRLLLRHPKVTLSVVTSETYQGKALSAVFPAFGKQTALSFVPLSVEAVRGLDVLFLALPHTTAIDRVPEFLDAGLKVIDLSADYRLASADVFAQWYKVPHTQPDTLKRAVYGLPELHRERIREARLVANPGCYPTGAILALAPLMVSGWIDADSIVADCKSGVSGAGRKPSLTTQFAECNEAVSAYSLTTHRHTPEIEQELSGLADKPVRISFSPHLMPMTRGLLSTVYARTQAGLAYSDVLNAYKKFYKDAPFVRFLEEGTFASTHHVAGSNYCDLGLAVDARTDRIVVTSAIDNLVKGAAGQAVQNLNLMLGFEETTALEFPGIFP